MTDIRQYSDGDREVWNQFCRDSKNGTFMFDREYMEYHSDRFEDHSLIVRRKGDILAILPANIEGDTLVSHGGLTFGGFVADENMRAEKMLEVFDALEDYAEENGISKLEYKAIPYIYHRIPSSEDRYGLYRADADLVAREVTSVVDFETRPEFHTNRQRGIDDAEEAGLEVKLSNDFETYWQILKLNLAEKHNTEPVHSLDEIQLLHNRFPENLKLFTSYSPDGEMVAGVVVYESQHCARSQYIANSDEGRDIGGLDIVFDYLLNEYYNNRPQRYFDFGISTEERGDFLNEGLAFFKEGFGARSVVHDHYEVEF